MNSDLRAARGTRRARFQTVGSLLAGAILLLPGLVGAYLAIGTWQTQSSYHSAPACSSLSDALAGKSCRYAGTATLVDSDSGLGLVLAGAPNRTFMTSVSALGGDVEASIGDQVPVELWSGRVTLVDGAMTDANPDILPSGAELFALCICVAAAGAGIIFLAYRRRNGTDDGMLGLPAMNPLGTSGVIYRP